MTNNNFKNNKTKTATTITASLVIGIVLLSSMTLLPSVNGQKDLVPPQAKLGEQKIVQTIDAHPGWVGLMHWNVTGYIIDYLGPANANPFIHKEAIMGPPLPGVSYGKSNPATEGTFAEPVNEGIAPVSDRSGQTSEWKVVGDYGAQASNVANVNLHQIINALNSNNQHWMQAGLVYDKALQFHETSPTWRLDTDSWTISTCTEDSGFAVLSTALNINAGDSVENAVYAQSGSPGQYATEVNDFNTNAGALYGFTESGDTGNVVNLGEKNTNVNACTDPNTGQQFTGTMGSGPQQEEHNFGTGSGFTFNPEQYNMGFYDTSTSSKTTTVTGWDSSYGCGASVATSPNPAWAKFTYTGC